MQRCLHLWTRKVVYIYRLGPASRDVSISSIPQGFLYWLTQWNDMNPDMIKMKKKSLKLRFVLGRHCEFDEVA